MATELAAAKLPTQEAEEFRSDVNRLLKQQQQQQQQQQHHQHCNLTPAQCRALTQLKQDNNRVILTANKGVAMVVMDLQGLKQQGTGSPTRHKHLPSSTQGPHPPTQKQAYHPPQKHTPNRRPQHS